MNYIQGGGVSTGPQMQKILHMYRAGGSSDHEVAPFLGGYIGEHTAFYRPDAKQLAGLPRPVAKSNISVGEPR